MLTKCPECDLPVSDKAVNCPHCGYPLKQSSNNRARRKPNKRRRLPNGFGQISELKGLNLRKPFRAMVTIGKTDEGKPICKLLQPEAYFETYNEAYQALMEYNRDPYVFSNSITVGELFKKWYESYSANVSKSSSESVKYAWGYCNSVENIKVSLLRPRHIRYCIEEGSKMIKGTECKPSPQIQKRIKSIFNKMLDYALSYELVDKNYSRNFRIEISNETESSHHIPYTDDEMNLIKENIGKLRGADIVLFQCYSGWRPGELFSLKIENISLEQRTMLGGIKTKAGKNRLVPIHPAVYDIVEKYYNIAVSNGSEYLFSVKDKRSEKVDKYRPYTKAYFALDMSELIQKLGLNPNHKQHDGRAHFITQAKRYGLDEYAIKYIVGHTISDITESVYTTRKTDWLMTEIQKIP